ncbi:MULTISPECIES: cytidine deaminase [unclassified Pseudofrankia]|uniref:cytidine deaminase n=1 Tax=unclassified Pseudofrankia TaxID=2994372 RepID=UPI0008D9B9C3|nr:MULTISPECIES: cytidine deaminase [unclassified Pseudofrankia]MDT3443376.1 cytidine deaminase [Pseudofrankia sp. BMG5.37]OHV64534.1 cytidine deaminase [Pseudofrankia sp. BMG5.36]
MVSNARVTDQIVNELVRMATEATEFAYAPYSNFQVGAALLTGDGRFCSGANVENRSYPMSICAERAAIVKAVTDSREDLEIVAVAVAESNGGPCAPCGGCRQVISEFARTGALLIYRDALGVFKRVPIEEALPDARAFLSEKAPLFSETPPISETPPS